MQYGRKGERRGEAYAIAVMLMVLITVALSTVLYAYFSGWVGEKSESARGFSGILTIAEAEARYDHVNREVNFTLYVRNDGSKNVTIDTAIIVAPNFTVVKAEPGNPDALLEEATLMPGSTGVIVIRVKVDPADYHGIWTVKLIGDDGSQVAANVEVE